MGDHREKQTVATIATIGGETIFETKTAKSWLISVGELPLLLTI
jgi:hypothetical protein